MTDRHRDRDRDRRRYRVVVFRRPRESRPGTIVLSDPATAHREARTIAEAGGYAVVQYVEPDGTRTTLASYP